MLFIVIPVYNEGENIKFVLQEIGEKVKTPHKVFVVYDFDEDTTVLAVKDFLLKNPGSSVELLRNRIARGVVNAAKAGFAAVPANAEACAVVMGDASDDIGKIDDMFALVKQGYDVVCASRYMKGGAQIGGPQFKKFLSRLAGLSLHILTRIPTHDATNSFRMYSPRVVREIEVESERGFAFTMELTVKAAARGFRITEIPAVWRDRTNGVSNFNLRKFIPVYLHWYLWFLRAKAKQLLRIKV